MARDLDDPDMTLDELLRLWPQTAAVFFERRMLCVGCEIMRFHTIRDACLAYDLEESEFRAALRRAVRAGARGRPGRD